jgi:small subunit ribosomal protein S1
VVTGRISDVKGSRVTVELGEGVSASFNVAAEQKQETKSSGPAVDVSALSSMLASKWKGGGAQVSGGPAESAPKRDVPKAGQVRSFRIVKLDAEKKKIEIELAE